MAPPVLWFMGTPLHRRVAILVTQEVTGTAYIRPAGTWACSSSFWASTNQAG